jgi:exonuclease 3'-5' domain-containing protein 2
VTVHNQRRKVALIQLCSPLGLCALFRVCKFSNIPNELRLVLENPEIIKLGITPSNDGNHLLQDYSIKMNGTFDLRFIALLAKHKAEGLAKLSKSILDIELDKEWRVRCSDWEVSELSAKQIDYASKDAFVAIEIFRKLYKSIHSDGMRREAILRFCDSYTDIAFKNKFAQLNVDSAADVSPKINLMKQRAK